MSARRILDAGLIVLAVASPLTISAPDDATLTVKVTGAVPSKGQLVLTIFTSKETFLEEPHATKIAPIGSDGHVVLQVNELKPGTYAVSVYYDQDNNGKLNTGLFGIPTELVGFSNNARGLFGPPSFREAAFDLSSDKSIEIKLRKAKD